VAFQAPILRVELGRDVCHRVLEGGDQVKGRLAPPQWRGNCNARHLTHRAGASIVRPRQMLIRAARNLEAGREPPGLDPGIPCEKIRSEEIIIGPAEDPWQVAAEAGETAQRGERLLV
jgi:hypothetical protein